jgi:hypothetical protein
MSAGLYHENESDKIRNERYRYKEGNWLIESEIIIKTH